MQKMTVTLDLDEIVGHEHVAEAGKQQGAQVLSETIQRLAGAKP